MTVFVYIYLALIGLFAGDRKVAVAPQRHDLLKSLRFGARAVVMGAGYQTGSIGKLAPAKRASRGKKYVTVAAQIENSALCGNVN